jgi:hypothetical protein
MLLNHTDVRRMIPLQKTKVPGRLFESKRARNTPVGSGLTVMDSGNERRVWSGGWSTWPCGN